jgi:hypothetical protein
MQESAPRYEIYPLHVGTALPLLGGARNDEADQAPRSGGRAFDDLAAAPTDVHHEGNATTARSTGPSSSSSSSSSSEKQDVKLGGRSRSGDRGLAE